MFDSQETFWSLQKKLTQAKIFDLRNPRNKYDPRKMLPT